MGLFKKKQKKENIECNHQIGDGTHIEKIVWKGRCTQPYKHQTNYICELCGDKCIIIHDDAIVQDENEYHYY